MVIELAMRETLRPHAKNRKGQRRLMNKQHRRTSHAELHRRLVSEADDE